MAHLNAVGLLAASIIALGGAGALAADPANPDWPCIQRKVVTLTSAQMWDGPAVDDLTGWRDNEAMTKLIAVLVSRRVPIEQAAARIAPCGGAAAADRRGGALEVPFARLPSYINTDRATVMNGIERFQRRQKARASEIERQGAELRQLKERAASDEKARAELATAEDKYDWDVRVFTERQQSLPLACEVPGVIEQRLFGLARGSRPHVK